MSEENSPAPRRSQRDRKAVQRFISGASTYLLESPYPDAKLVTNTKKRKRNNQSDTEDDAPENVVEKDADLPESEGEVENDDEEADFEQRTPKNASIRKKTTTKKPNAVPKIPGRRGRKAAVAGEAYDADKVAKDTKIAADNPLFSECVPLVFWR